MPAKLLVSAALPAAPLEPDSDSCWKPIISLLGCQDPGGVYLYVPACKDAAAGSLPGHAILLTSRPTGQ